MSQPPYYNSKEARIDTILGDEFKNVIIMAVKAKREYDKITGTKDSFYTWLKEIYGVELTFTSDGDITTQHTITDEKKFIIFTLKFGGN